MSESKRDTKGDWIDPDDAPEWTDEMFDRARFSVGGKVVREATGTLTRRGRPPVGDAPKKQVTLRLPQPVIEHFKAGGAGWQTRIGEVLERHVGESGGPASSVRESRSGYASSKEAGKAKDRR